MYEENDEEQADVKNILTSDEKGALIAREKSYASKLEIITEKFGTQDKLDIEKLDSEIGAKIESMESIIGNIERDIRLNMSTLELIQTSKGYDNLLDVAPQLKNNINILKTIMKGMIQQINFHNIIFEYLTREKKIIVEKLRTNKNSEVVLGVIEKMEKIQKTSFETLKEFYQESLNSVKDENRMLRARLFGESVSEKNEEEKIKKEKAAEKRKIEERKKTALEIEKEPETDLLGEIG